MNTQNIKETNNDNIYIQSLEAADIYKHNHRGEDIKTNNYVGMLVNSLNLDRLKECGLKTFKVIKTNKIATNDLINVKFNMSIKSNEDRIKKLEEKVIERYIVEIKRLIEEYIANEDKADKAEIKTQLRKQFKGRRRILKYVKKLEVEQESQESIEDEDGKTTIKSTRVTVENIRKELYENGFYIEYVTKKKNKETGEYEITKTEKIKYMVYKRTASKSRTSQVLFIKDNRFFKNGNPNKNNLHDKMMNWARLGMNLNDATDIDYTSLLSYESLVDSSIEDTVKIDTKGILLVSDVKSLFNTDVNLVRKKVDSKNDTTALLESVEMKDYQLSTDLFDGESILDSSHFTGYYKGKGMILLRQHMFKSCAFNCNIQKFMQDMAISLGENIETWELSDMFGNKILAKDVRLITTPNSMKCLKYSSRQKSPNSMYKLWKDKVEALEYKFGICKTDKASTRGFDKDGKIMNQTSYQILNSLPLNYLQTKDLAKFETDYIDKLKNDPKTFIEHLEDRADKMNSNEMWAKLYKINPAIVGVELFKDKRAYDIHSYTNHVKRGKIRLTGDYCTIVQNVKELLYHAVGKLPVKGGVLDYDKWKSEMILSDNEIYTTLHKTGFEYACFRNPHTSQSNVLVAKNVSAAADFIEKYFVVTPQIVYVNAIGFELPQVLSGSDCDSDQMLIVDNEIILEAAKKCFKHYKVCENGVGNSKTEYKVNSSDMAKIDGLISESQKFIGTVTNMGQLYMSKYNHAIANGDKDKEKIDKLLQGINICTILSGLSIDYCKRIPDVDIKKQISQLKKDIPKIKNNDGELIKDTTVPNFFKYVSKNDKLKGRMVQHSTTVDYLYKIINDIKRAEEVTTVNITDLLVERDMTNVKKAQLDKIIGICEKMNSKISGISAKYKNLKEIMNEDDLEQEEMNEKDNCVTKHMQELKVYKITEENMYAIIKRVFTTNDDKLKIEAKHKANLLKTLYNASPDVFLKVFKPAEDVEIQDTIVA